ncbi:MAG: hypothetical protein JNL72_11590 [Flavipsychrobacter sp.]|nr:hypothetical protein [Flavipsychrobacter sp.]
MIKRADIVLLLCMALGVAVLSCTQQRSPCFEPKIVSVALGTYRLAGDTVEVDTFLTDPEFICIDTPLRQTISAKNRFSALLSPFVDSTRWLIIPHYDDSTAPATLPEAYDTLTFYHSQKLTFISNACGYAYYYTLTGVKTTYNSIDSILITNNSVDNNASTQHVKIYY